MRDLWSTRPGGSGRMVVGDGVLPGVQVVLKDADQAGQPEREPGALGRGERGEQRGMPGAEILAHPGRGRSPSRGEAQAIQAAVGLVPLADQPSPAFHARSEPAHRALLQPEPDGQVPLRQRVRLGELTEGEHLGDRDVHPAVVVHLQEPAGLRQPPEQPPQLIVREGPRRLALGCVGQLFVLRSSARVVRYNYRRDAPCRRSTAPTAAGSGPSTIPTATTAGPAGSFTACTSGSPRTSRPPVSTTAPGCWTWAPVPGGSHWRSRTPCQRCASRVWTCPPR